MKKGQERQINFFMVGAPKCGTTALYDALRQHPDIFLPVEKELHYFAPDFYPQGYITWNQYLNQFKGVKDESVVGESSVWYLYSSSAPKLIHEYNPKAKILIMLRDPRDMIRSLHSQNVFDNLEQFPTLEEAMTYEAERKNNRYLLSTVHNPIVLYYSEIAEYYKYVKRYYEIFTDDLIKVVLYDDYVKQPGETMQSIFDFLKVDHDFRPDIKTINIRKKPRSKILRAIGNPPFPIKNLGRKIIPFAIRRAIIKGLNRLNALPVPNGEKESMTKVSFNPPHDENINKLSELLKMDLSGWYENNDA